MEAFKKIKLDYLVQALVTIVIGLVLIIWTAASLDFMARALAVLLALIGLVFIVAFFFKKEKNYIDSWNFALGILIAAIGIWIFLNPSQFTDFIPKLFGVFIIVSGLMNLAQTVSLIRYNYGFWWISLILAIITVVLGGILLFNAIAVKEFVVKVIGIFLVYDGISNIWTISRVSKFAKKAEQARRDSQAVDVEAEIVDVNNNKSAER